MHKLCRIDIGRGKEIYKEIDNKLRELAEKLRVRYNVSKIIPAVLGLTDLPIEPWCYTEEEFRAMIIDKNDFITEVLKDGKRIF